MLIEDLLGRNSIVSGRNIQTIRINCSQFLKESAGLPLFKNLPSTYHPFHKVKVRMKKHKDVVGEALNRAFESQYVNLSQRAIFTYSSQLPLVENYEPFYVFPINGYKYLYSKEVKNSTQDYRHVIDTLFEEFEDMSKANETISDLLKFTYSSTHLYEGIMADSEIIMYGIPYYYAIQTSSSRSYSQLLSPAGS